MLQHPPTFAVGERVSRIARRASFDGQTEVMVMQQPFREPEPKRQSLMEPLATAVSEPVVAAAPPVSNQTTMMLCKSSRIFPPCVKFPVVYIWCGYSLVPRHLLRASVGAVWLPG